MSTMPPRRGPQGVQGVQGIEGVEGIEGTGVPGEQGIQGERGERGRALPRTITLSFIAVVAVATLIVCWLAVQQYQLRQFSQDNRDSIASLCHTTTTLDAAVVVPLLAETSLALRSPFRRDRAALMRLRQNLEIAHEELSDTEHCEEVR